MTRLPPQPQVPLLPGGPLAPVTKQVNRLLNTSQAIQIALIVIFVLPLLAHLVNMLNIRLMSEAYEGFPAQLGVGGQIALVSGLLVGGYLVLSWLCWQFATVLGLKPARVLALLGAGLIAWAWVGSLPNAYRVLYYIPQALADWVPVLLLALQIGFLLMAGQPNRATWAMIGVGVLAVVIGGFGLPTSLLQIGLALIVLIAFRSKRLAGIVMLIAAPVAFIAAQLIWNGGFTRPFIDSTLWRLGNAFFGGALTWIGQTLALNAAVPFILSIVLCATAVHLFGPARQSPLPLKQVGLRVIPVVLVAYLLLHFCFLGAQPLELHAQAILIGAGLVIGYLIGLSIRKSSTTIQLSGWVMALVTLLLIAGPIVQAGRTLVESRQMAVYAGEWDARDQAIREAVASGQQTGRVRALAVEMATFAGLPTDSDLIRQGELNPIARYYGLSALVLDE